MDKIDFKRELGYLYNPTRKDFALVDVPSMNFLTLDGHGGPNTSSHYQETVSTLYALAYALRFLAKKIGVDFVVLPLEGLWRVEDKDYPSKSCISVPMPTKVQRSRVCTSISARVAIS